MPRGGGFYAAGCCDRSYPIETLSLLIIPTLSLAALCLAGFVAGCGDDPAAASASVEPDSIEDISTEADSGGQQVFETFLPDIAMVNDTLIAVDPDSGVLIKEDAPAVPEDVKSGAFGSPCVQNSECDDGFCVQGPSEDYVCSQLCIDSCAPG
jgi:hypothetical protein